MRPQLRIPVFTGQFLFHLQNERTIESDVPDYRWIDSGWSPDFEHSREHHAYDSAAEKEIFRVLTFKTCPFCRSSMVEMTPDSGKIYVCTACFYWAGRGARPHGIPLSRANLGRINFVNNPEEVPLELLINHLARNTDKLLGLSPNQAEKILPSVLSDYLSCEVKAFGVTHDKGIDALAMRGEKEKMLIQIKWHEDKQKTEGVGVVREVGGTLLARGLPNGWLVSTRQKFSKEARKEASLISEREILGIGPLQMDLKSFADIIDMFEISALTRDENIDPTSIIPFYNEGWDPLKWLAECSQPQFFLSILVNPVQNSIPITKVQTVRLHRLLMLNNITGEIGSGGYNAFIRVSFCYNVHELADDVDADLFPRVPLTLYQKFNGEI
jgi:hypothetical protein